MGLSAQLEEALGEESGGDVLALQEVKYIVTYKRGGETNYALIKAKSGDLREILGTLRAAVPDARYVDHDKWLSKAPPEGAKDLTKKRVAG